jgi:uncharacterized protein with HEPN domain
MITENMEVIGADTKNCYIKISYAYPEIKYFKIDIRTYSSTTQTYVTKLEEEGISITSTRTHASVFIDKDRVGDSVKIYF